MGQNRAKKVQKRKAKKKKHLQVLNRPSRPRACGDCMECCQHFPVIGLPGYEDLENGIKPAGTACMHLTENPEARCGIYTDPKKPPVCDDYKCLWLWDGEAKKRTFFADDRPDISGVIFGLTGPDHPASKALKKPIMVVRPTRDGALDGDHARTMYNRFLDAGRVLVLIRGPKDYEFLAANPVEAQVVAAVYKELPHFKVLKKSE